MTIADAKLQLRAVGVTLHKSDGEYRVAFAGTRKDDTYSEAYFTNDLADAVATGLRMAAPATL